jgi:hypothetical protein
MEYQYWVKLDNDGQPEYFCRFDNDQSIEIWYQDEWRQTWSTIVGSSEEPDGYVVGGTVELVAVVDTDAFMEDATRWRRVVDEDADIAIAEFTAELNHDASDEEWPPRSLLPAP